MLGVLPPDLFDCDEGRRDLPEGATIIAFTDGASESTDARGQQLGLPGLRRLIETAPNGPLADHLAHTITARRAAQPTDDTLIVEITPHFPA
jgi:serine phosphatase RsbU (regulator of sigma subunit)